jgi:phospholipid/cholesterol/gamma-HCH transport system substrate-binding protein
MKKEVKVGLFGIIALAIFYFGFNFLKGLDLFSTKDTYYTSFKDVQGLEVSNPVTFNGVNVGRVTSLSPDFKTGQVKVEFLINEHLKLNKNSEAILADDGLLGGKVLKLIQNQGTSINPESEIKGVYQTSLVDELSTKIDPTLKNADELMLSITKVARDFDNTGAALKILLASAGQTTAGVNGLVASNSKNIHDMVLNAETLTANLNSTIKGLDAQIKPILANAKGTTDSLQNLQLRQTINALNDGIGSFQQILVDINSNKGTLGKLKGDDSLYVNLDRTAASLNALLGDMKQNPKRYVHFSLFGKKANK